MPLGMVAPNVNHHHIVPQEVETIIDIRETTGFHCLGLHPLLQTGVLRATGVRYQWLPLCHLGLIDQMDPGIPNEGDGTERMFI